MWVCGCGCVLTNVIGCSLRDNKKIYTQTNKACYVGICCFRRSSHCFQSRLNYQWFRKNINTFRNGLNIFPFELHSQARRYTVHTSTSYIRSISFAFCHADHSFAWLRIVKEQGRRCSLTISLNALTSLNRCRAISNPEIDVVHVKRLSAFYSNIIRTVYTNIHIGRTKWKKYKYRRSTVVSINANNK